MSDVTIRPLERADWDSWKALWEGYLSFYREELAKEVTRETFERLCDHSDGMFAFVAEPVVAASPGAARGAGAVGLVHGLVHPSTWATTPSCYLEDLYVDPASRGSEVARELIRAVAAEATLRGATKIYWHTQEYNGRARSLYDQLAHRTSVVVYELELSHP
ncbi:MAG: GNAT family N-acetyltransferase [Acidimicrobiales bacterium]